MAMTTSEAAARRQHAWIVAANLAITISIFGYLFRHVRPGDILDLLRNADLRAVAMFVALSLTTSVFRLWRYRMLLRFSGYEAPPGQLFLVVLVRNAFSDLLPARLGTLIDIYFFSARMGIPLASAVSCFSLTFVFEILALAPLVTLAAWRAGMGGALSSRGLLLGGLALLGGTVVVLAVMPWGFRWAGRIFERLVGGRRGWLGRAPEMLKKTGEEIDRVRAAGLYGRLLALSLMLRVGKYSTMYVCLYALLAPLGFRWSDLDPGRVFLGLCASELAASLPISGIAGFGIYEGTWAVVFRLLGFEANIAKMTGIAHHLFTQAWGYGIGAAALVVLFLPIWRRRAAAPAAVAIRDRPLPFYARVVALGVAATMVAVALARLPASEIRHAAGPADTPTPSELAARADFAGAFGGDIVFDSSRSGSFGIWRMSADGARIAPIADSPAHEIYPEPSPDGRWIAYARSATLSKRSPSEIRLCRPDGSEDRRLADNGTFPTFSPDGRTVYFEQERLRVMAVSVDGGEPRQMFPGPKGFGGFYVVKPRMGPDGRRLVFISNRGGARGWQVWVADLVSGELTHLGAGCEPAWYPDGRRIAHIRESGMRQGTGIVARDLADPAAAPVLADNDAPLGHEYFPTVTRDGEWLLWGACRPGQHEHLAFESNYQLFAKRLPDGPPVRLTFDGWNNRWPKKLPAVAPAP